MELAGLSIRVLGALGLVLACLFLIVYGLKRSGYLGRVNGASNLIEIIARRPLQPKCQLMVIKVEEHYFLIGTSPQGIHRLGRLDGLDRTLTQPDGTDPQ
ncbi:MAG: hypothetical protein AUK55_01345 [Syntrophobacteraceae bacterium CG2_30_61_12]|nr:MAG: hypothetical protein AUK55_01345 [Syntrophobacteraceae bacterium CG2_30_61_12]PIU32589.1 MAG: hypothetical protein COT06_01900 [Syntrophobacteraceae bacterium CG07_land_8_20_14_0_80_61_8]